MLAATALSLFLEPLEVAEVVVDGGGELARRPPAGLRRHVLPEDRVQDVPGEVEREGPLERRDVVVLSSMSRASASRSRASLAPFTYEA